MGASHELHIFIPDASFEAHFGCFGFWWERIEFNPAKNCILRKPSPDHPITIIHFSLARIASLLAGIQSLAAHCAKLVAVIGMMFQTERDRLKGRQAFRRERMGEPCGYSISLIPVPLSSESSDLRELWLMNSMIGFMRVFNSGS